MKREHELAKFFPLLQGEEFDALCADVKTHGLINTIVLYEDKILDGRNRERACDATGVKPRYVTLDKDDALAYAVSMNVKRRHLTQSQLAVFALDLEAMLAAKAPSPSERGKQGGRGHKADCTAAISFTWDRTSAARAAKALNIGGRIVTQAKFLQKEAPQFIPEVRAGTMTVGEALNKRMNDIAPAYFTKKHTEEKKERVDQRTQQVKDFLSADKAYNDALAVALDALERFSDPTAVKFISRRLDTTRKNTLDFESHLKKAV